MARIAMTELSKNPELALCDAVSFLGAIIQCSQLGLEPGSGLGHAYLIPFNNRKRGIKEVVFIPGYRGLIDLMRRSGRVLSISATAVHEKDEFEFIRGDGEKITHKTFRGPDPGPITDVYSIARLINDGIEREAMTFEQIEQHRERFSHGNPVWKSDWEEMAKKTVIRRIAKRLPLSPELAAALAKDDDHATGHGQANWSVLDASYEPLPPAHEPGKAMAEVDAAGDDSRLELCRKTFIQAYERAQGRGWEPDEILGRHLPPKDCADPKLFIAATDILLKAFAEN